MNFELRNDLVNLSEHTPHFLNGKASISNFSHFPNIGRSATVNFRHGYGESGFGGRDGGWRDGSNWGGSGGGNWNNGDGDLSDDFLHPGVRLALYLLLFLLVLKILHWISKRFQKALEDLQKYLNTLIRQNPQNIQTRLYSLFLKFLYGFLALLVGPEAFEIALRTLGNPLFRALFYALRFCSRCALIISLFLGGSFYGLHWYKRLMSIIGPVLDQTVNFLAGPQNVALPVLFLEKLIKAGGCSLLGGFICLCLRDFRLSQNKKRIVLLICGCGVGFYVILMDFHSIRLFAQKIAAIPIVHQLISCQLGRFSLLLGSIYMTRYTFFQTPVFFTVFLYGFGIVTLAFSASPHLFPPTL